ncbi:hypothetical protein KJ616_02485 [Patescibacteria group bacterium]|nr:hypothetical protein [Patescibacteria group bacterium]
MPTNSVETRAFPCLVKSQDHHCHPLTQDWMNWMRTRASGEKLSSEELLKYLEGKIVPYTTDPKTPKVLYWLTKAILAGPVQDYYPVPARADATIKAYFYQHPDSSHPRHQRIAPQANNLTANGLYLTPENKAVPLRIVIQVAGETKEGDLTIEKGELILQNLTLGGLVNVMPRNV